jgi:Zn finger protein HypA/HybF involved in hydrogenase expression
LQFLNKIFIGFHLSRSAALNFSADVIRTCQKCGKRFKVEENEKQCRHCRGENNS